MAFVGPKVFMPASLVVLVTGIILTEKDDWGWSTTFIVVGLVGWALLAFTGFGYLTRAMKRVGARLAAEGPSPELKRLVLTGRLLVFVLFVVVLAMVAKPGV